MSSSRDFDYSRPQAWRNLPQQQERMGNSSAIDYSLNNERVQPVQSTDRSTNSIRAASYDTMSLTYSGAAVADNASVAAAAQGATDANESTTNVINAIRSSVDTAVDTMWEARRKREKAEEEADQKLLDAVCKASLVEYNARERALEDYESETTQSSQKYQTSSEALQHAKIIAEERKRAAMQTVIDSKTLAQQMKEKAREATWLYEQKNSERLAKQAESQSLKLREAHEVEMRAVQKRKEEAMRKRTEAEQKARNAREKAEAMRRHVFQAASKMRANSRRQIETQLSQEEVQRRYEMQRKLDEIKKDKELAHQRKEAAAKKAENARRRAEELCLKAKQAQAGLKSSTAATSSFSA
ncbi:unnamed protein product [Peronospora belbahrii]|uniref:Uncharacterized protein n=1 Tax=Peronospora belbahrii TaxID=622444 RepID=A0AAU9KQX3_9STRA|nr:unnamed protein product [Peronospora belbahrii]CAH0519715.1 unnamed protein product [Peronospora belbahrii]